MKKLFLSLFLIASFICNADIPTDRSMHNTLITAIARNDLGTVQKTLESFIMTPEDKEEFLQIADQMIITAIAWRTKHHNHAEIGKETFKAFGYWIATVLSGAATAISADIIASTIEARYDNDKSFGLELLPKVLYTATGSVILAGLTTYLGYKAVQHIINAWLKPSQRLENALRIKDIILHTPAV